MKEIWKFPIDRPVDQYGRFYVDAPKGTHFISAILQNGEIVVYGEVTPSNELEKHSLLVLGTGKEVADVEINELHYFLGTVVQHPFVWHVYAAY